MADFLDKMLKGINKGVNSVSENSKILIEKAKLNTALSEENNAKIRLLQQLGAETLKLYRDGKIEFEEIKAFCDGITEHERKSAELNKQIQLLSVSKPQENTFTYEETRPGKVCSCGFANKPGAKFCASCGNKLEIEEV